jgi:G3E family GTPase
VCCEVRDDLIGAIDSVLRSDEDIDAIVLEASGVAEPIGIARTFTSPGYRHRIRLDGIIAVVDAEQLPAQAEDKTTRDLVFGQIGFSDMVILNKIDLADAERLDEVRRFIYERIPNIRIVETSYADVPFDVLVGSGPSEERADGSPDTEGHQHHHAEVGHQFVSWVYQRDEPFDIDRLKTAIAKLPRTVYRVKGFVFAGEDPEHRHLLQAVGMRGDIEPFDAWGHRRPSTELVVIATSGQEDRPQVEALFDAGLSTV